MALINGLTCLTLLAAISTDVGEFGADLHIHPKWACRCGAGKGVDRSLTCRRTLVPKLFLPGCDGTILPTHDSLLPQPGRQCTTL